jgi:serine phosphatase RsbU (regulator of sigma subunit)
MSGRISARPEASTTRSLTTRVPRHVPTGVLVLLAIVPILVAATVWIIAIVNSAFALQADVFNAISYNDAMFRSQLNEQAGIRGFAATGQTAVLEQYYKGRADFDQASRALIPTIERIGIPGALERIRALQNENLDWITHLALPTIANRTFYAAHLPKKTVAGSFRGEEADLDQSIQSRAFETRMHTRNAVRQLAAITVIICAIIASLIIYASQRQRRLLRVIESEQGIIATLQSALINHLKPVPGIEIGTAYISATDGAAVGGDFFDVQPLNGTSGYILVGDVSGKGVNAAVDTALVRHGIRSLLVVERDPGVVLSNFNEAFIASRSGEEIFVAMFLGIIDTASRELRYASAGHGQAYLRTASSTSALPVTGLLIGVETGTQIATERVELHLGDLLFLATDGLTEARNADLVMLDDEGAMRWIQESKSATAPQALVEEIVARLKGYTPKMRDDLAILALRIG